MKQKPGKNKRYNVWIHEHRKYVEEKGDAFERRLLDVCEPYYEYLAGTSMSHTNQVRKYGAFVCGARAAMEAMEAA